MMDWKRLAEIEARANAATPGPWFAHAAEDWPAEDRACDGITSGPDRHDNPIIKTDCGHYPPEMPDAEFIAHARTDIPDLIAEIRRLQHESRQEGRPARSCKGCGGERVLLAYCDNCKTP